MAPVGDAEIDVADPDRANQQVLLLLRARWPFLSTPPPIMRGPVLLV
ncbi:unnamed protein product [Ectocarpus sp. 13 AM-2016]